VEGQAPRSCGDSCGFGQDVVATVSDVAEFLDGFVKAAAFGGIAHGSAMKVAEEKLVRSGD
jgi:hypothetical protein